MFTKNTNELERQAWLSRVLGSIPPGSRILDAGAGELQNRKHCGHLEYVSQDFGQYTGEAGDAPTEGLQNSKWDTSGIDLISDIVNIPAPDSSFDVVLCSEVLEHVPEPDRALNEFSRLLKPGGMLILTAPFVSNVHMAPYHYCSGFSKYWYEHHLAKRGFELKELTPNGDWYGLLEQELRRLGSTERQRGNWSWPLAYAYTLLGLFYFRIRRNIRADDLACFGWHCVSVKNRG